MSRVALGCGVGLSLRFDGLFVLLVDAMTFDFPDDAVGKLFSGSAAHAVGQMLVEKGTERLSPAATVKNFRPKRAFPHLFQQRSKKGRGNPFASRSPQLLMPGKRLRRYRGQTVLG
jgi:hypothetical protein